MLRSYKTEINPTPEQAAKIRQTIGVCRYVYNFYLAENKAEYERTGGFLSAFTFSKWLNNEYLPSHDDKAWIHDVSSKAIKKAICNAERAFKNFFAGRTGYPHYKKKRTYDATVYFVKTDRRTIIACDRHRIKIPTLGWVRIKEKGYIPTNPKTHTIKSGTVSYHAGRYYVSVLVEEAEPPKPVLSNSGVGIDLGVKDFAFLSDGTVFRNINKTHRVRKLNKRLKHEQRRLSGQYEMLKQKGGTVTQRRSNIEKQKQLVQKLYARITAIRTDYINKTVAEIVKTKPSYITIEDLNVVGMMKNRHLARAVQEQRFSEFRTKLSAKCTRLGIELRVVDRFYPSSKTCHCCGSHKADLKLKDRTYVCESCGYSEDRDLNAALNLRDATVYKIAYILIVPMASREFKSVDCNNNIVSSNICYKSIQGEAERHVLRGLSTSRHGMYI